MKKIYFLLFLTAVTTVSAQQKLSVFGGPNYPMLTDGFAGQISGEKKLGLHLGASIELDITDAIAFRPRIMYSQQGDRTETPSSGYYDSTELRDMDYKLNYLAIPLDIKFWDKVYVFGGPQISFLISKATENRFSAPLKSTTDIGVNLGTGFTMNKVFVEVSAYQGFTTLFSYKYPYTGGMVDVRNAVARFTVGYNFW